MHQESIKEVDVGDGTFYKSYERGLFGNVPEN